MSNLSYFFVMYMTSFLYTLSAVFESRFKSKCTLLLSGVEVSV